MFSKSLLTIFSATKSVEVFEMQIDLSLKFTGSERLLQKSQMNPSPELKNEEQNLDSKSFGARQSPDKFW